MAFTANHSVAGEPDGHRNRYVDPEVLSEWRQYSDSVQSRHEMPSEWWRRFEDPLLDSLITLTLENNYDVRMAARRIEMARAAVGSAKAAYYPQLSLSAGWIKAQTSGLVISRQGRASRESYFDGTLSMNWEMDVFGKITSQVKAGKERVQVSKAEWAGVMVSLEAQMASAYVELRVQQAQLQVARDHTASQFKVMKIAEARFESGIASMLDVDQARTVYYSTVASIPMLENSIHASKNAIALLLGEPLDKVEAALNEPRRIPPYLQMVETGVPMDLLRRRPDVVEAEKNIGVLAAELGIAKKDWLPTLTLTGTIGTQAHHGGDLFKKESFGYTIAPTLSWTVFDGLARNYNITSARQSMLLAIDNYNLTILTAVEETDNALSTYFSELKYIEALEDVVKSSGDYDRRAIENYKSGLSPFINVAQAQMSYLENINTLISARGSALNALIDLYRALGGGWSGLDQ